MTAADKKILKAIIAFALKYPEKLAKNIYVHSDHQRHYGHKNPITLMVKEDKENILKSSGRLSCGDYGEYLYNIGFDDIARAYADTRLKTCRCGKHVHIAEMCHGGSGMQWLEIHCKCGITMNTGIDDDLESNRPPALVQVALSLPAKRRRITVVVNFKK